MLLQYLGLHWHWIINSKTLRTRLWQKFFTFYSFLSEYFLRVTHISNLVNKVLEWYNFLDLVPSLAWLPDFCWNWCLFIGEKSELILVFWKRLFTPMKTWIESLLYTQVTHDLLSNLLLTCDEQMTKKAWKRHAMNLWISDLTHFSPMSPFYIPWKPPFYFQGV